MKEQVLSAITETGIIAIMRGMSHGDSLRSAEALIRGGIKALEVTYNTPGAASILLEMVQEFGNNVFIGAGTVTTEEHLESAIAAGAQFILGPHFDQNIVEKTVKAGLVAIPGAFTATEVLQAHRGGASIIKIFPASSVGPQYIKDLKGPLNTIPLMPVGGVDLLTASAFIKAGSVALGVGSSLIQKEFVSQGRWDELAILAGAYLKKVQEARR